jgi:hypothetical protein
VIYSPTFDGLPLEMRNYLWMRLEQVLNGREPNEPDVSMPESDRKAVLEILRDTKPEFKAWLHRQLLCPRTGTLRGGRMILDKS